MDGILAQPVLVLNRLWQAVNVVGAKRAFSILSRGHAQVVHVSDEDYRVFSMLDWIDFSSTNPSIDPSAVVHTVRHTIRVPRVILLSVFDKLPCKELKLTRNNVFERDRNRCQYCWKVFDRRSLNLDHVIPRHSGGKTTWENVVCSCVPCNTRKGNRLPHEAGMRLFRKPTRPRWRPVISQVINRPGHQHWKGFLDIAYWNVELTDG